MNGSGEAKWLKVLGVVWKVVVGKAECWQGRAGDSAMTLKMKLVKENEV